MTVSLTKLASPISVFETLELIVSYGTKTLKSVNLAFFFLLLSLPKFVKSAFTGNMDKIDSEVHRVMPCSHFNLIRFPM